MQEIDTRELRLFQNFLANKLKAPTANICFKILNAILNDAVIDGIILHNPGKGIKAIKENNIKATATYHRALTVKEQDILFYCRKSGGFTFPPPRSLINLLVFL